MHTVITEIKRAIQIGTVSTVERANGSLCIVIEAELQNPKILTPHTSPYLVKWKLPRLSIIKSWVSSRMTRENFHDQTAFPLLKMSVWRNETSSKSNLLMFL